MEKGKYGIYLWFYAVLAFIFAFLGQTLLGGVLLGFVIITEKNDWLTKQTLQAFLLTLFGSAIQMVLSWLKIGVSSVLTGKISWELATAINAVTTTVNGFVNFLSFFVNVLILVLCIVGILKVTKGQDANIPVISKFANRAFGIVEKKVYTAPTQPNPQTPTQQ